MNVWRDVNLLACEVGELERIADILIAEALESLALQKLEQIAEMLLLITKKISGFQGIGGNNEAKKTYTAGRIRAYWRGDTEKNIPPAKNHIRLADLKKILNILIPEELPWLANGEVLKVAEIIDRIRKSIIQRETADSAANNNPHLTQATS